MRGGPSGPLLPRHGAVSKKTFPPAYYYTEMHQPRSFICHLWISISRCKGYNRLPKLPYMVLVPAGEGMQPSIPWTYQLQKAPSTQAHLSPS